MLCGPPAATAIPAFPSEFYGTVHIGGEPAPAGTLITAFIGGVERGSVTTTSSGTYGGPGTFDQRLVVRGTEEESGLVITFTINGVETGETAVYRPGETIELDLTATGSALPTTTTTAAPPTTGPDDTIPPTTVPATAGGVESPATTGVSTPEPGDTNPPTTVATGEMATPTAPAVRFTDSSSTFSPLYGVILVMGAVIVLLVAYIIRGKE
ncbi:hypothetical protein CUJ86_03590 [Methanofollis fontis]|uniref:Uncharacterized protein n=1 Tax=Methanofollis fontis TaxID=2052832 RepID=A0A483CRP9_9EURY|nr:hypothetical protein CUJ86_03590 [Methanofollis fontis]